MHFHSFTYTVIYSVLFSFISFILILFHPFHFVVLFFKGVQASSIAVLFQCSSIVTIHFLQFSFIVFSSSNVGVCRRTLVHSGRLSYGVWAIPKLLAEARRDENERTKAEGDGSNTPWAYPPGEFDLSPS